ncbi:hypothetical protein D3C72_1922150 [compost metagenome]
MAVRCNQTRLYARIKALLVRCGRFIIVQNLYIFRFGKGLQRCPVGEVDIRHVACSGISFELLVAVLHRRIQLDLDLRHFLLQLFHRIVKGSLRIIVKVLGVDLQLYRAYLCRRRIRIRTIVGSCIAAAGRQHQRHGKRYQQCT